MTGNNFNQVPQSLEAEQSVIGALLLDPQGDRSQMVLSRLQPEMFYQASHRLIYATIRELNRTSKPVDLITVTSALEGAGQLTLAGGFSYVAEINHRTPSAANIVAYANTVRDKAVERQAIEKAGEIQRLFTEASVLSLAEKIDMAQTMLSDVVESSKTGRQSGLTNISAVLDEWVIEVEERFKDPDANRGLKTGITPLDAMLAPKFIVRGSLFVVGARPKMGKTTVLTEMAKNVSDSGLPVALFSMEMTNKQLAERMISQKSGISSNALYDSGDEYEWGLISKAMGELSERPNIWLDDTPGMTLAHIQAECRKLKRKTGKIGFIGVDYLTLMKAGKADRNDIAYGEITKGLKQLAKELDTTVVLLTQLNRKLEDRADKRPMPSDSRDTGQIEQDCDYWLGIYKDSVYNDNADKTLTELIVRLNRHGKAGTAYVEQKGLCMFDIDQTQAMVRAEPPARHNPRQKDF